MKFTKALLAIAAIGLFGAANANAQSLQMAGIGSSALFLEAGQAVAISVGASCVWTAKGFNSGSNPTYYVQAVDTRTGITQDGTANVENGQAWIAWTPSSTGNCYTGDLSASQVYFYVQTDSTVGDRCVMANPACTAVFAAADDDGTNHGANLLSPTVQDQTQGLPAAIFGVVNNSKFNVAGTDIRAEDAKFATIRALTPCGKPVDGTSGTSQYLGLGYTTGNPHVGQNIKGASTGSGGGANAGGGSFHVYDFNLVGNDPLNTGNTVPSFKTYDVGAAPIVVFVNPSDAGGFGSLLVNNVTRLTLAGYLDGTYGSAGAAVNGSYGSGPGSVPVTVFVREPLSGTYNTMEYAVPNNTEIKSSQDIGLVRPQTAAGWDPQAFNCTSLGGTVAVNPLAEDNSNNLIGDNYRYRTIGTGNEVAAVLATKDSLGYAFWSAANFKNATAANAKYLTVDGIDPLQQVWTDGLVPTSGNALLGNVSLANVKNGSYPIWSKLRMIATASGQTGASNLASKIQNFLSPSQPDFVPISQLPVVRSHFAPPYDTTNSYGLGLSAAFSGTNIANDGAAATSCGGTIAESGGDVGGMVTSLQAEGDFCADVAAVGNTGRRQ